MAVGSKSYQYLVGICVNFISVSYGAFCGWPSASFLTLQSDESPLDTGPLTAGEAGWIGATLCIGGAVGTIMFSWSVDKLGRRLSLILMAVPALIGWLIIPYAQNPIHLCISRFFGGIAGGGAFGVIPLYITEIADDEVRGVLGTFLLGTCNAGVLIAFIAGYFCTYKTVAWLMVLPVLLYVLCFFFLPETPQYLMNIQKYDEAEKTLRYLRNARTANDDFKSELAKLNGNNTDYEKNEKEIKNQNQNDNKITMQDFKNPKTLKAFLIGIGLMSLNQFCGLFAMINYTATIFKVSGSNFSPNMSAIIVGIIQLFGSSMSSVLVERCGRKKLLCGSAIGTAFGHVCLGSFIYLTILGYNLEQFSWIPLVSFSFTIFIGCWGVLPLPFIITAEVMPPKLRNIGCMIGTLGLWIFAFTMLKMMPTLLDWIGLHGLLFMCGGYCLASVIFVTIFVPETRGKSVNKILALL